jgi:amino acid adenylation domain-containing protein
VGAVSGVARGVVERARTEPAAPALIWRGAPISYGELASMMWSASAQLGDLAPGPVGLAADKSPEGVALLLGCAVVGLPTLLPASTLPSATLSDMFKRAGCRHVVALDTARAQATSNVARLADCLVDLRAKATPAPASTPDLDDPDPVCLMLTTSGSTGLPKIVPLTTQAIDRFTNWAHDRFDVGPGRRVLSYAPLNFDLSLLELWATLRHGGCVVMVEPERAASGPAMLDLLSIQRPHVVQAVPILYELLLDASPPAGVRLDSVDQVIVTGDTIRPARAAELGQLFGRARFYNVYGCTETNDSFLYEFVPAIGDQQSPIPLGQPLPGVHAVLVDEDGTVLDGPGVGELLVNTPFQTPGYLNTPGTEGRFGSHPHATDDRRYFRSGDLVRRADDGTLVLSGRLDFQVKVRGHRVNLSEVEQVLLAHPNVVEAAAVAVPDLRAGCLLHAVARRDRMNSVNSLALRRHCADRLPRAAIPSTLHITDQPLPRTSTGKVDRKRIESTRKG